MGQREGAAEGEGRAEPAATAPRISRSALTNCVGSTRMGEGFAENSGRWLGQIGSVPSQRALIGSQQPSTGAEVGRGVAPSTGEG